jgi:hypothetical protein
VLIVLIVFIVLFLVLPIVYLAFRARNEEFVSGGSYGEQISGSGEDDKNES